MGYDAEVTSQQFTMSLEQQQAALKAIKTSVRENGPWWVARSADALLHCKTIDAVLDLIGWSAASDEDGNIKELIMMDGKLGDEETFFKLIGPYVPAGSFVAMLGGDGEVWRWYFDGTQALYQEGKITY